MQISEPHIAAEREREHRLNSIYRLTVAVLLVVVTMTFGSLIAVFLLRSTGKNWTHIHLPTTLWLSTIGLLASSLTFEKGRKDLVRRNDQHSFYRWTGSTIALALLFLAGQTIAWWQILNSGVLLDGNPHSSFVFLFLGTHGLHVILGLAGFAYLLWRTREPAGGPRYQMVTRVVASNVALFWHYLDVLWVFLFALLVFWRS